MDEVGQGLMEISSLLKNIALTVAAIIASYVGIKGLGTWRRQLRGNTEYTLAKNVLTAIYELRGAISSVRFWISFHSPGLDLPEDREKSMSEKELKWHALVQSYEKKWEPVSTARAKLQATLFEAEAVWGHGFIDTVDPIHVLTNKLRLAIQSHLKAGNPNTPYESPSKDIGEERRAILYWDFSEQDDFNTTLNDAIHKIEIELKPHITQHHS